MTAHIKEKDGGGLRAEKSPKEKEKGIKSYLIYTLNDFMLNRTLRVLTGIYMITKLY